VEQQGSSEFLMQFYDIFNGDADGICALQQLRLEEPRASVLVTGVKRDVRLLDRVHAAAGDELTVLDISLRTNAADLGRLLAAGEIPRHPHLRALIDTAPDTCTSLIVDRYLEGRQRLWAVVAAFGDNLTGPAQRAAAEIELDEGDVGRLRELGEAINYNAYGETVDDLHYHPADLFATVSRYPDPRDFIEGEPVFETLQYALAADLDRVGAITPQAASASAAVYVLPDAAWSRRIHGFFANQLARRYPRRAHALLVSRRSGYTVSVRAPIDQPRGADALCQKFETGGGRQAAAGINSLPEAELPRFVAEFNKAFPG
jgi:hypothetical protein